MVSNMPSVIDTERFSAALRSRSINTQQRKILVTNFHGSDQEKDFKVPANCNGFGRIRHFYRDTSDGWPANPLPIDPAYKALGGKPADVMTAQVFQNASCNWRCWYCYVPFSLLAADEKYSAWLTAADLLDLYINQPNPPRVIDLSGGQPDLVPEWIPWMMEELKERGLEKSVYLWSDDNLSNDYFFRYLSEADLDVVVTYRNYGKVCCFKGFDSTSFAFNTGASEDLFTRQLDLMKRYVELGLDVYGYVTLTTPCSDEIDAKVAVFVDLLQGIHTYLPLRVVPLEIKVFTPVMSRVDDSHRRSIEHQQLAKEAWNNELRQRFSATDRERNVAEIVLHS